MVGEEANESYATDARRASRWTGTEARAGPAAAPLAGGGATANMATVAAAERASRPRSAEGMLLPVALGDPSRGATLPLCRNSGDGGSGCATTVVTAARSRPPDAARREYRQTPSEPRAPPHCPPRHNSGSSAAQGRWPSGGRTVDWVVPSDTCAAPQQWRRQHLSDACHNSGDPRARAALQGRVETRCPPARCLRPRSRHRPAAAKAASQHSGAMPAN